MQIDPDLVKYVKKEHSEDIREKKPVINIGDTPRNCLKKCIELRRKKHGLKPLKLNDLESKKSVESDPVLNPIERERYERRKESNRKASEKLRKKRLKEAEHFQEQFNKSEKENSILKKRVKVLELQVDHLQQQLLFMSSHVKNCKKNDLTVIEPHCYEQTPVSPLTPYDAQNSFNLYDIDDHKYIPAKMSSNGDQCVSESECLSDQEFEQLAFSQASQNSLSNINPTVGQLPEDGYDTSLTERFDQ